MAQSGAWAEGIANALQGLQQGVQQRNARNMDKAGRMLTMALEDVHTAEQRNKDMPGNKEAAEAYYKSLDAYDKAKKELQKYAKVDPSVWSRISQIIDGVGGHKKPTGTPPFSPVQGAAGGTPNQAPTPTASGPSQPPAAQPNLNQQWVESKQPSYAMAQQTADLQGKEAMLNAQEGASGAQERIDERTARLAVVKAVQGFMQDKDYNKALATIRQNHMYAFSDQNGKPILGQETLAEMSLLDIAQQMGVQVPDAEARRKALKEQYELETKQKQQAYKAPAGFAKEAGEVAGPHGETYNPDVPWAEQDPEWKQAYAAKQTSVTEEQYKKLEATVREINRRQTGIGHAGKPATVKPFQKAVQNLYRQVGTVTGGVTLTTQQKKDMLAEGARQEIERLRADGVNVSDKDPGETDFAYVIRKSYTEAGTTPPKPAPTPTSGLDQVAPQ